MVRLLALLSSLILGLQISGCADPVTATPDAGASPGGTEPSLELPTWQDSGPKEPADAGTQRPDTGTRPEPDAGAPTSENDGGVSPIPGEPPEVEDAGPTPTECGNGILEDGEICDGSALSGVTCRALGLAGGTLACKESCLDFEPADCEALPRIAIAAAGDSVALNGTLSSSSPMWRRPSEFCGSAASSRFFFEPFAIVNESAVQQTVRLDATFAGDGYLHIYEPSFQALSPLTGCIFGNDNFQNNSMRSVLDFLVMAPGEVLIVVVSTAAPNEAIGDFEVRVETEGIAAQCGNGILESGERCDGAALGDATCASRGFDEGQLACASDCLSFNEDGCTMNPIAQATPIAVPGSSIALSGALEDADGRWHRRNADCSPATTSEQVYETHRIVNQTGAPQYLRVTASWNGDGYLFAYRVPFSAPAPENGCIAGDDDFEGLNGSQLEDLRIEPDETLVLVASSYGSNVAIGEYQLDVLTQAPASCGDGIREQDEICDGTDLEGNSCYGLGFRGGSLLCNADCQSFNSSDCFSLPEPENIAAPGESIVLSGVLEDTDPRYRQPTVSCSTGTLEGQFFDTFQIRNQTGAPQSITLTASWSDDGMLHVYTTSFNSAFPTFGCLKGGDDFEGVLGSQIDAVEIANGETLVVVASTYRDTPTGAYSIDVKTRTKDGVQPIGPLGTSIQLTGSIDASDPTWNRPFEGCGLAENTNRHYDVHRIVNNSNATADLTITANWQNGDGFLHLVTSYFDFENPDSFECLGGNDDFGTQEQTRGSRLASSADSNDDNIFILPGEELFVVASTFAANNAIGAYSIEVFTGATDASPPTAAALAPPGQTLRTYGTLHVTDPTWTIPAICGGPNPELEGRAVDAHAIVNDSGSMQDVVITATWGQGNGLLGVYLADAFDPSSPGLCLASGDNNASPGQSRVEEFLLDGETLMLVVSSADEVPLGTYELAVQTLP